MDRVMEGERLYDDFRTKSNDNAWFVDSSLMSSAAYDSVWSDNVFPMRLGGNARDKRWLFTAQDVIQFSIGQVF